MTILSPRWLHRIRNETVFLCLFQWDCWCWYFSCLARRINAVFFATMSQYPTRIMNPRLRVRHSTSSDFSFLYARWVTVAIKFARLYVIYRIRRYTQMGREITWSNVTSRVRKEVPAIFSVVCIIRIGARWGRTFSELIELAFAIRYIGAILSLAFSGKSRYFSVAYYRVVFKLHRFGTMFVHIRVTFIFIKE